MLGGVDPKREQHWLTYTVAMLFFHAAGFLILYAVLRVQGVLPFNPTGMSAVARDLSFNTAISFITNTNWQNYGGESTLSYFTRMLGLTHKNNAAHPFENPTAPPNFVQMISIFAIGAALTNVFGRMVCNQRQGWAILAVMGVLFIAGVTVCYWAEASGT